MFEIIIKADNMKHEPRKSTIKHEDLLVFQNQAQINEINEINEN